MQETQRVSQAQDGDLLFRVVRPEDEEILADLFGDIDETYFRPHPFTREEACRVAERPGRDVFAILIEGDHAVAYGMLRGWEEGYPVPSLGIAVRTGAQGRGLGRLMMTHLHAEAARRGATVVRLRVHPDNVRARLLYETLGYIYAGEDRGELVMLVDVERGTEPVERVDPAPQRLEATLLGVDAPEWEAALRVADHDFYHLPAYVELCATQEGGQPRALYVTDGRRVLLLPLIVRDVDSSDLDAVSPYGYPGPVGSGTDDPAFVRVALAASRQALLEAGIVSVFVRLHPLLNPSPPSGIGTLVQHGDTVSIDLTLATEVLWAQTRLNHRRDITRTLRAGFIAHMDEEWTSLEAFKHLYRATMTRRSAAQYYFFSDAYFDALREALGERLHLCVVERDGVVVAGGLFVEIDGLVQYHLSGTDAEYAHLQPTKLMMHFVRGWAKKRGNRVLHLGGGVGGGSDSLLQYKVGFSPRRHTFGTLRMVVDEVEYRQLVLARDPSFDPDDRAGFFPLYRHP